MRVVGNREGFVSLWECNTCICVGLIKEEVIDVVSIHNPNESCNVEMTVSKGAEGCVRYVKCSPFQKELMLCFFSVFASPTPKLSLSSPFPTNFCVCFFTTWISPQLCASHLTCYKHLARVFCFTFYRKSLVRLSDVPSVSHVVAVSSRCEYLWHVLQAFPCALNIDHCSAPLCLAINTSGRRLHSSFVCVFHVHQERKEWEMFGSTPLCADSGFILPNSIRCVSAFSNTVR